MLAQPFFMRKAQTFSSPGFVITQSLCNFRHYIFVMAKLHFRPYIPNQTVLFPQRIDENIAVHLPRVCLKCMLLLKMFREKT